MHALKWPLQILYVSLAVLRQWHEVPSESPTKESLYCDLVNSSPWMFWCGLCFLGQWRGPNGAVLEILFIRGKVFLKLGFKIEPVLSDAPFIGLWGQWCFVLMSYPHRNSLSRSLYGNFAEFLLHSKLLYSKKSSIIRIVATTCRPRGSIGLQWCEKRSWPLHYIQHKSNVTVGLKTHVYSPSSHTY